MFSSFNDISDLTIPGKIELTGKKWDDKKYYTHSQYPGGLKTKTAKVLMQEKPTRMVELAIKGKKASVPFLDFQSSKHYEKSRAGILHHVLYNIQEHLSDYMSVTLSPLETLHSVELKETILKKPKHTNMKKLFLLLLMVSMAGYAQDNITFKKFDSYQLNVTLIKMQLH